MINLKNRPLCLAPSHLHCAEQLAAAPGRRAVPIGPPPKGTRAVIEELNGVLTPELITPFTTRMLSHAANEEVGLVVIYINSPGGTVEGTLEAAEAVARCTARKPTHVICEGYCASGAYWIASQATSITASPSCLLGSLGVIQILIDDSILFKEMGVSVIAVSTTELKTLGVPGIPVKEAHLAMHRRLVDVTALQFEVAISKGRGLSGQALADVFTGDVWYGAIAKSRGLVDRVELVDDAFARIMQGVPVERYVDLTGAAAYSQFMELANANVDEDDAADWIEDVPAAKLARLTKEFPTLAGEARTHETRQYGCR